MKKLKEPVQVETEWVMPKPVFRSTEGKQARKSPAQDKDRTGRGGSGSGTRMGEKTTDVRAATLDPQGETAIGKKERSRSLQMKMTAVFVGVLILLLILWGFYAYFMTPGSTPGR